MFCTAPIVLLWHGVGTGLYRGRSVVVVRSEDLSQAHLQKIHDGMEPGVMSGSSTVDDVGKFMQQHMLQHAVRQDVSPFVPHTQKNPFLVQRVGARWRWVNMNPGDVTEGLVAQQRF